jgi:hypothetical protein
MPAPNTEGKCGQRGVGLDQWARKPPVRPLGLRQIGEEARDPESIMGRAVWKTVSGDCTAGRNHAGM